MLRWHEQRTHIPDLEHAFPSKRTNLELLLHAILAAKARLMRGLITIEMSRRQNAAIQTRAFGINHHSLLKLFS